MCNVLPGSWDFNNYARALPRWTVAEYFEKLELFLRGEFTINHKDKSVLFRFSSSVLSEIDSVALEYVVDEFSTSVKPDGSDCEYMESMTLAYKDADHQLSNYYSCPWFVGTVRDSDVTECQSVSSLIGSHQDYVRYGITDWAPGTTAYKDPELEKVFHVPVQDLYFMLRHAMRTPASGNNRPVDYYDMQPLNMFGPSGNASDESSIELEFVPACIDYTEPKYGKALFVNFGSYSEDNDDSEYRKSALQRTLENGEKSDTPEYFNMIYVAYYDGTYRNGVLPHPEVCDIILDPYQVNIGGRRPFNLRLNDPGNTLHTPYYSVDRTRKMTFKFLSDDIPNPRALFYIHGRRYVCEKITATFTEDGMSQLLKGEFWPLLDD